MGLLTYNFDEHGDEYTYEYDNREAEDYILRTHSYDDILNDFLSYVYPKDTDGNKKILKDEFGFDGTEEAIPMMDEELKEELCEQVVYDLIDIDLYNDELEEYFEADAYEEYREEPEWVQWQREYDRVR